MSIKSDRWIRRMAEAHGMIEPFEAGQVRSVDGKRIVSYDTSTNDLSSNFFGSTIVELRFVNSLNSLEQRTS